MDRLNRAATLRRCLSATAVMGAATLLALGAGSSPDRMLSSGFNQAIASVVAPTNTESPDRATPTQVSGSEAYWLSAGAKDGNVRLASAGPNVGDVLSLRMRGRDVALEILSISRADPGPTRIDVGPATPSPLLVTARDSQDPDARPLSFLLEVNPALRSRGTAFRPAERLL